MISLPESTVQRLDKRLHILPQLSSHFRLHLEALVLRHQVIKRNVEVSELLFGDVSVFARHALEYRSGVDATAARHRPRLFVRVLHVQKVERCLFPGVCVQLRCFLLPSVQL